MKTSGSWPRVIVHADMDAFYASIEQHDNPALKGKPVLVGPRSERGVVLTASYEARPFRVGSAMPMTVARRRCPQAIVVPPRFDRYREVSSAVMDVFHDFSPQIEAISLDEAFLDMTGSEAVIGDPEQIGRKLKAAIREATDGLTASVGVSATKFVAKVASNFRKPDGLTVVPAADAEQWLAPQSLAVLWGAGPKTRLRLEALGLATVGDVAAADPAWLETKLGRVGRRFHALAQGHDDRPVAGDREARSLSSERTLESDTRRLSDIKAHLRKAAETVAARLRQAGIEAGGVRVKLKRADFRVVSRQQQLRTRSARSEDLYRAAEPLAAALLDQGPFRLIGIAAYDLASSAVETQLDLLSGPSDRAARLDRLVDQASAKFGAGALTRARQLSRETILDETPDLDFLTPDGPQKQR